MKNYLLLVGAKTLLAVLFLAAAIYTGWPDGLFCREVSMVIYGDLDRQELMALHKAVEPGMSELQLLDIFRENKPSFLNIMPNRDGFIIRERGLFPPLHWHLKISCKDNKVTSIQIRRSSDDFRPTSAPQDKGLDS